MRARPAAARCRAARRGHEGAHDRRREHRPRLDRRLAPGAEHERPRSACGLATDYHGIQFPSLPNYIALTSGQVPPAIAGDGVKGRRLPARRRPARAPTRASSPRSAPRPPTDRHGAHLAHIRREHARELRPANVGEYAPGTTPPSTTRTTRPPATRSTCRPARRPPGRSHPTWGRGRSRATALHPQPLQRRPRLVQRRPPRRRGGRHDRAWMPAILASPDYHSGHLLVVITADTSQSAANGNLLATILVNPDIPAGTRRPRGSTTTRCCGSTRSCSACRCSRTPRRRRHGGRVQPAAAGSASAAADAVATIRARKASARMTAMLDGNDRRPGGRWRALRSRLRSGNSRSESCATGHEDGQPIAVGPGESHTPDAPTQGIPRPPSHARGFGWRLRRRRDCRPARSGRGLLSAVGGIVIARLLIPSELGIVAFGTIVVASMTTSHAGLGAALIRQEASPADADLSAVVGLQLGLRPRSQPARPSWRCPPG